MKKLLLVSKGLSTGGIETSLVNIANELSHFYQVDLFLYDPTGVMKSRLNPSIQILPVSRRINALGLSFKRVFRSGNPGMIWFRLWATAWTKLFSNKFPMSIALRRQKKMAGYDLAIAFHHESRRHVPGTGFARVVEHCVEAKMKAVWLHYDCGFLDLDSVYHQQFYQNLDKIVCVSRSLQQRYQEKFPHLRDKVDYCYNFLNIQELTQSSTEPQAVEYPRGKRICFSACRLAPEKALSRGVRCLAPVFREHPELMWYIAGNGLQRPAIEEEIKAQGLEQQVILLGNLSNPYPYMKNADLLMNVSYHEAAPMVFLEAKALGVPVFATETSSARELLADHPNSWICENTEKGIHDTFCRWVSHPSQEKTPKISQEVNAPSLEKLRQWLGDRP